MKTRLSLLLSAFMLFSGCSTADIQQNIDDALNNGNTQEQQSTIDQASDEQAALERHNAIRAEVFTGSALLWSDQAAADAQSYADTLAASGAFEHDPKNSSGYDNGPYGENLYASTVPGITMEDAVDNWYVELDFYDYSSNSCSVDAENTITVDITTYNTCGHYTQLVWKETTYVGCAKAQYQTGTLKDGYVVVCKYKDPGNVIFNGVELKPY